jgi:hypothetical protein
VVYISESYDQNNLKSVSSKFQNLLEKKSHYRVIGAILAMIFLNG